VAEELSDLEESLKEKIVENKGTITEDQEDNEMKPKTAFRRRLCLRPYVFSLIFAPWQTAWFIWIIT